MTMKNNFNSKDLDSFKTLRNIGLPSFLENLPRILLIFLGIIVLIFAITPWRQSSKGLGYVIASNPNNRALVIHAAVAGRISKWYVQDGSRVRAGDKLVEIIDNDPLILERLKNERDAKKRKVEVAKMAAETSKIDYGRQEDLLAKGLSSRKSYELAKIEYKKLLSAAESASAELAESEIKLSRQESQLIVAPRDGVILKVLAGDNSTVVKVGDEIASFAPQLDDPAVELYVGGNDIPLIYEGRKVRLQFEGWPAVQFSGWPEVAVGTFGGVVSSVDSSVSQNGKFRVIVKRDGDEKWPDARFLRHGAKVYGWVLLNQVLLGYELWRQINAFPPSFDEVKNIEKNEKK
jgi:multidrug efflux pump subunit AcrA (membrane-fusion protein)